VAFSNRSRVEQLLDQWEPEIRNAFLDAIDDVRSNVTFKVIVEKLERGDIDGAISALQLDPEAFADFEDALFQAYVDGGRSEVENLPKLRDRDGNRVIFRFGARDLMAEGELRRHGAEMVTRITDDMKATARARMVEGLRSGQNPRTTALDVIGRINRATGKREGGILGLTVPQERFVASARQELLSGDPAALRNYLARARRDRRFDAAVRKAIADEKPVPTDLASRAVGRYADRLLQLRGEMVARTETLTVLAKARDDAIRQQINAGKIDALDVTKTWRSAGDDRVRHTHRALNGKTVNIDGRFQSPSGAFLAYPGDPSAPTSETVGCRCHVSYSVDYGASVVRRFRGAA